MMTKTCNKCGETKPITEFYVSPNTKDGKMNSCIVCKKRTNEAHKRRRKLRKISFDLAAQTDSNCDGCGAIFEPDADKFDADIFPPEKRAFALRLIDSHCPRCIGKKMMTANICRTFG